VNISRYKTKILRFVYPEFQKRYSKAISDNYFIISFVISKATAHQPALLSDSQSSVPKGIATLQF
jgi:hypothetical protein